MRDDFDVVYGELLVVGIDEALTRRAGELAEAFGLRVYDAVHLASALLLGADTIVVTWDRALGVAAARSGCGVSPDPRGR